ncbi:MAG: isoprenyl transferase [Aquisalinus sp.]|nr:isoprenyl transferase [Aquisalinus sp.]
MPIKSSNKLVKGISGIFAGAERKPAEDILDLQAKVSNLAASQSVEEEKFTSTVNKTLSHVAIIMDGNGRWAEQRGLTRQAGHQEGVAAARRAIETAKELGLTHLTLYSFSTENWGRPESEVRDLMNLMRTYIESDLPRLVEENIRVRIIGDKSTLPVDIRLLVNKAEKETAGNTGYTLQIAFNYGGRDELIRAFRNLAADISKGTMCPEDIDERSIASFLDTGDAPDPDLVIRTSGERRISNFLLWQAAYAEYIFLDEYWPDFTRDVFMRAVDEYHARDRRFGRRNTG